jgi:hypothetical protein
MPVSAVNCFSISWPGSANREHNKESEKQKVNVHTTRAKRGEDINMTTLRRRTNAGAKHLEKFKELGSIQIFTCHYCFLYDSEFPRQIAVSEECKAPVNTAIIEKDGLQ